MKNCVFQNKKLYYCCVNESEAILRVEDKDVGTAPSVPAIAATPSQATTLTLIVVFSSAPSVGRWVHSLRRKFAVCMRISQATRPEHFAANLASR